jgi:hypothetical protein
MQMETKVQNKWRKIWHVKEVSSEIQDVVSQETSMMEGNSEIGLRCTGYQTRVGR